MTVPLRIGVLGASRIAEVAIIDASRVTGDVLATVAARDSARAQAYAIEHGFAGISESYDALISDDTLDLIYIGLPNGLHAEWAAKALDAGRSVLVEKPFAANLEEFDRVVGHLDRAEGQAWEAFHYADHPAFARMIEIAASDEIGTITGIDVHMEMPAPPASDPRWNFDLAGGAMMDLGCYALNGLLLLGEKIAPKHKLELLSAHAESYAADARVDARVEAALSLGDISASITISMVSNDWDFSFRVRGTEGDVLLHNFVKPQEDNRLHIIFPEETREERVDEVSSYVFQLQRIRTDLHRDVWDEQVARAHLDRSRRTMALIDDIYTLSGLPLRPGSLAGSA